MLVPRSFLFHNFRNCLWLMFWLLKSWNSEPRKPEMLVLHSFIFCNLGNCLWLMFWLLKSQNSKPWKPKILVPRSFLFAISGIVVVDVLAFEVVGFRTPKSQNVSSTFFSCRNFENCLWMMFWLLKSRDSEPWNFEMLVPHSFLFAISGIVYGWCFWILKSWDFEPRNPEMLVPCSFLFAILGFVCVWCLAFEVVGFQTPKSRNAGHFSHFWKFVYVDIWTLELVKFRTPKSRNTSLIFLFFRISEVCSCWCWTPKLTKFQTSKSWNAGPTFPLSQFWRFVFVDVRLLYLRNPELRNPELLDTFHNFGNCCVLMLVVVLVKYRTPKSRHAGHFSRFRKLLCVNIWTGRKTLENLPPN